MNASMLLMTAWIAGADVVPAGCSNCAAPAPAPAPVAAAPVAADCGGCDTCGPPAGHAASGKLGLLTKLKGLFASKGGHHKAAACDTCGEAAPACDGCSGPAAAAPAGVPAVTTPATPVATPTEMPKTVPPAAAPSALPPKVVTPKEKVVAPQAGGFDIPVVVTPVSQTQKVPALGSPANPF